MIYLQKALTCAFVLHGGLQFQSVQSKEVKARRSRGNYILHAEMDTNLSWYGTTVDIKSNVPVTVKRYFDDLYFYGEQPVLPDEAYVLVTSDCAATTYVPKVTFGPDAIEVNVQGAPGGVKTTFLKAASYRAAWDIARRWCDGGKDDDLEPSPGDGSSSLKSSVLSSVSSLLNYIMATQETDARSETSGWDEERNLLSASDACNVNVEVMFDGCAHGIDATAPKIRILDAEIENASSEQDPENKCVYNEKADIMFNSPRVKARKLSLQEPSLEDQDFDMCWRAVPGRPFVDATGSPLEGSPLIAPATFVSKAEACAGGSNSATCLMDSSPPAHNGTTGSNPSIPTHIEISQSRLLLGREWTKNAIGEHASIASFSAFSIALMTNGAPSDLVEDALKAGLDEVRHAKTSFAIASKLTGREVTPGPLPESEHVFGHDAAALALAVAREGCVDETLSALEAAAEVDFLEAALANGADGTEYAGVAEDVLAWIRDELRTIAKEESGHASLAWRTVRWVCGVDADACDLVKERVLNEGELERAFRRRFASSFGANSRALEAMAEAWRQLHSRLDVSAPVAVVGRPENVEGDSLVAVVAREIFHGIARG